MHAALLWWAVQNNDIAPLLPQEKVKVPETFNCGVLMNLGCPILAPSAVMSSQVFNLLLFLPSFACILDFSLPLW